MTDLDAQAERVDIAIDQGDDETFAITRQDSDGNAIDITNYEFWLTVKSDIADTDGNAVVQDNVTSHTDPTNGKTELKLTNSDTSSLAGNYVFDIQEKTGGGTINTVLFGSLYVREDVTDSS